VFHSNAVLDEEHDMEMIDYVGISEYESLAHTVFIEPADHLQR